MRDVWESISQKKIIEMSTCAFIPAKGHINALNAVLDLLDPPIWQITKNFIQAKDPSNAVVALPNTRIWQGIHDFIPAKNHTNAANVDESLLSWPTSTTTSRRTQEERPLNAKLARRNIVISVTSFGTSALILAKNRTYAKCADVCLHVRARSSSIKERTPGTFNTTLVRRPLSRVVLLLTRGFVAGEGISKSFVD